MGLVIGQIQRVDHADAGEGEAILAFHPVELFHRAEGLVGRARKDRGGVFGRGGAKADADAVLFDLDQRLKPDHAARAGADDVDLDALFLGLGGQRGGHLVGAERLGGAVEGDVEFHAPTFSRRVCIFALSMRPITRSSTIAAGAQAQSPRQ